MTDWVFLLHNFLWGVSMEAAVAIANSTLYAIVAKDFKFHPDLITLFSNGDMLIFVAVCTNLVCRVASTCFLAATHMKFNRMKVKSHWKFWPFAGAKSLVKIILMSSTKNDGF